MKMELFSESEKIFHVLIKPIGKKENEALLLSVTYFWSKPNPAFIYLVKLYI